MGKKAVRNVVLKVAPCIYPEWFVKLTINFAEGQGATLEQVMLAVSSIRFWMRSPPTADRLPE